MYFFILRYSPDFKIMAHGNFNGCDVDELLEQLRMAYPKFLFQAFLIPSGSEEISFEPYE